MDHQTTDIVARSGFAGGMLTTLFLAVQATNIADGALLASVGAASSFVTVRLLRYLFEKLK